MRDVVRAFPFRGLVVLMSVTLGAACAISSEPGSDGTIPTTTKHTDAGHVDAGGSIDSNGTPDPGTGTPDPGTGTPDPGTGTPDTGTGTPEPGAVDSGSSAPPPTPGAVDSGSGSTVDATVPTDTGSGAGTPACATAGTSCIDATGAGDLGCFAPGPAFPKGAKSCVSNSNCPTGWSCWAASASALTGSCIEDCTSATSPGTGTGTDAGTAKDTGTTDTGTKDTGTTAADTGTKDTGTAGGTDAGSTTCGSATVSFASTVFPALNSGCASCHSQYGTASKAYTTLTSSSGMGSACGKLVVAGNTSTSKIIGAVQGTGCTDMSYLSSSGITALTTWICQGAKNN